MSEDSAQTQESSGFSDDTPSEQKEEVCSASRRESTRLQKKAWGRAVATVKTYPNANLFGVTLQRPRAHLSRRERSRLRPKEGMQRRNQAPCDQRPALLAYSAGRRCRVRQGSQVSSPLWRAERHAARTVLSSTARRLARAIRS